MSDDFPSARQMQMRAVFERLSRDGFPSSAANPDLAKFEERVQRLRTKMADHLDRHRPGWWAQENQKLVLRHKGQLRPTLTPKGILQTETSPAALAKKAYENVEMRCRQRIERFENTCTHMRARLDQSPDDPNGAPRVRPKMRM